MAGGGRTWGHVRDTETSTPSCSGPTATAPSAPGRRHEGGGGTNSTSGTRPTPGSCGAKGAQRAGSRSSLRCTACARAGPVLAERGGHDHLLGGRDLLRPARHVGMVVGTGIDGAVHAAFRSVRRCAGPCSATRSGSARRVPCRRPGQRGCPAGGVVAAPTSSPPRSPRTPHAIQGTVQAIWESLDLTRSAALQTGSPTPRRQPAAGGEAGCGSEAHTPASADGVGVGPAPRVLVDRRGPSRASPVIVTSPDGVCRLCRARRTRPSARAPAARPWRAAR